jgi:hypothetical protein
VSNKVYPAWTTQEINYLKENFQHKHAREMAIVLGRTYGAVVNKLYEHRLSSTGRKLKSVKVRIYQKVEKCKLPVFHPVMVGINPVTNQSGSNSLWRKRRAIILKMHDNLCVYCGDEANSVDHVIPINKGGTDDPLNLVAACSRCNSAFGDKTKHIEFKISDVNHSHIVRR